MTDQQVSNLNVLSQDVLITPEALKQEIPLTDAAEKTVIEGRHTIQRILDGEDPPAGRGRPLLHPRRGRGHRLRAPPASPGR